jgi:hypothetical protein
MDKLSQILEGFLTKHLPQNSRHINVAQKTMELHRSF